MPDDTEPTIENVLYNTRAMGMRDVADAMEYMESRVQRIPEEGAPETVADLLDIRDLPLEEPLDRMFIMCVVFGSLLERRYPAKRYDEWPCDETDVPI